MDDPSDRTLDPATEPLEAFLDDCVGVDPAAISQEFATLPSHYARWNEVYARFTRALGFAQAKARRVRAEARFRVKAGLKLRAKAEGERAPNADDIEACIHLDKAVMAAEDDVIVLDAERTRVRGILTALGRKSDALVTIGANQRAELDAPDHMNAPGAWRPHTPAFQGTVRGPGITGGAEGHPGDLPGLDEGFGGK